MEQVQIGSGLDAHDLPVGFHAKLDVGDIFGLELAEGRLLRSGQVEPAALVATTPFYIEQSLRRHLIIQARSPGRRMEGTR